MNVAHASVGPPDPLTQCVLMTPEGRAATPQEVFFYQVMSEAFCDLLSIEKKEVTGSKATDLEKDIKKRLLSLFGRDSAANFATDGVDYTTANKSGMIIAGASVTMIAGGVALITLTGGTATPFLVGAGIMGAVVAGGVVGAAGSAALFRDAHEWANMADGKRVSLITKLIKKAVKKEDASKMDAGLGSTLSGANLRNAENFHRGMAVGHLVVAATGSPMIRVRADAVRGHAFFADPVAVNAMLDALEVPSREIVRALSADGARRATAELITSIQGTGEAASDRLDVLLKVVNAGGKSFATADCFRDALARGVCADASSRATKAAERVVPTAESIGLVVDNDGNAVLDIEYGAPTAAVAAIQNAMTKMCDALAVLDAARTTALRYLAAADKCRTHCGIGPSALSAVSRRLVNQLGGLRASKVEDKYSSVTATLDALYGRVVGLTNTFCSAVAAYLRSMMCSVLLSPRNMTTALGRIGIVFQEEGPRWPAEGAKEWETSALYSTIRQPVAAAKDVAVAVAAMLHAVGDVAGRPRMHELATDTLAADLSAILDSAAAIPATFAAANDNVASAAPLRRVDPIPSLCGVGADARFVASSSVVQGMTQAVARIEATSAGAESPTPTFRAIDLLITAISPLQDMPVPSAAAAVKAQFTAELSDFKRNLILDTATAHMEEVSRMQIVPVLAAAVAVMHHIGGITLRDTAEFRSVVGTSGGEGLPASLSHEEGPPAAAASNGEDAVTCVMQRLHAPMKPAVPRDAAQVPTASLQSMEIVRQRVKLLELESIIIGVPDGPEAAEQRAWTNRIEHEVATWTKTLLGVEGALDGAQTAPRDWADGIDRRLQDGAELLRVIGAQVRMLPLRKMPVEVADCVGAVSDALCALSADLVSVRSLIKRTLMERSGRIADARVRLAEKKAALVQIKADYKTQRRIVRKEAKNRERSTRTGTSRRSTSEGSSSERSSEINTDDLIAMIHAAMQVGMDNRVEVLRRLPALAIPMESEDGESDSSESPRQLQPDPMAARVADLQEGNEQGRTIHLGVPFKSSTTTEESDPQPELVPASEE